MSALFGARGQKVKSKGQILCYDVSSAEMTKTIFTILAIFRDNMAQAQLSAIKLDSPRSPYNPKFTPPQSQDAFGLELGHYDHRPTSYMAREDFAILTTTMDGIVNAMNVMSDQISNHTDMVVKELKERKEKNKEFMDKVGANEKRTARSGLQSMLQSHRSHHARNRKADGKHYQIPERKR